MTWILLSIWVALLKALSEFVGKIFMDDTWKKTLDEYSLALWVRTIVIAPVFMLCLIQGFVVDIWSSLFIIFLCWWLSAVASITAFKALKYWELSMVGPLWSLATPLMLITSFFITREVPNMYGIVWVLIIFIGTYFLGIDRSKQGILYPIQNISSNLGARYMLITAFIWSLTAPIDKLWVEALGTLHWLLYVNIITAILLYFYMLIVGKKPQFKKIYSQENIKKVWAIALVMGLWNILQLVAIKYTLVVYVAAIKRASGVFSVILWALYFREKNILWKLFAASLMVTWVACIVLGGNI